MSFLLEKRAVPAQKAAMPSNENQPRPRGGRRDAVRDAWRFGWIASAILFTGFVAIAAASRLEFFGAGFHVNFALILGVVGTILLGVGLMALSFYSDRSGADDEVVGMSRDAWTPENHEP